MKRLIFLTLLWFPLFGLAQESPGASKEKEEDAKTAKFLKNFATYFGINVEADDKETKRLPMKTPDFSLISQIGDFLIQNQLIKCKDANTTLIACPLSHYQANPQLDQPSSANDPTWQTIINFLTTPPTLASCYDFNTCLSLEKMQKNILEKPEKDIGTTNSGYAGITLPYFMNPNKTGLNPRTKITNTNDQALNLNTLLGPLNYNLPYTVPQEGTAASSGASGGSGDKKQDLKKMADFFIRFASWQANPPQLPPLQKFRDAAKEATKEGAKPEEKEPYFNFLTRLNTFVAFASVGISNFNEMYARRIADPNASDPKLKGLSQAEIEYRMATQRLSDQPADPEKPEQGSWRDAMEKAPPIVVQRAMLYLLAQINYQLYLQRVQDERILATLSAMQLQQLETMKNELKTIYPPTK